MLALYCPACDTLEDFIFIGKLAETTPCVCHFIQSSPEIYNTWERVHWAKKRDMFNKFGGAN